MKRISILILTLIAAVVIIGMNVQPSDAATGPVLVSTKDFYRPCVLDEKAWVGIPVDIVIKKNATSNVKYWARSDGSMVRVELPFTNNLPYCYTVPKIPLPKEWFKN